MTRTRTKTPTLTPIAVSEMEEMEELHAQILECVKCPLHEARRHAVPGEGNLKAQVIFIGEGPGNEEDRHGRPFVGPAGRLLNQLLLLAGLRREDVFITNVVKCRPFDPNDPRKVRKPNQEEISACRDYLIAQIALIKPKVICLLGDAALKAVLDVEWKMKISEVHGRPFLKAGIVYMPMFHPAAGLHQSKYMEPLRQDFVKLKEILEKALAGG